MAELQLDGTKLTFHVKELLAWKQGGFVPPILVEVSPTNLCNHRCDFCAYEYLDRNGTYLDMDRFRVILDELAAMGTKSLFYSGEGEPLIHKGLPDIIVHAGGMGFEQALNTNGARLLPAVADRILPWLSWVRWSINGVSREDYALHHRVSPRQFDLVMNNLTHAAQVKRDLGLPVTIGVQFVYLGQSAATVIALAERMKAIGVSYFAVKQFNRHPNNPFALETPPPIEELLTILQLNDANFHATVRLGALEWQAPREYQRCQALPFFAEIVANGDVYACGPHLGNPAFCYGNIHDTSFASLWSGAGRRQVEAHVCSIPDLDAVCMPNCRLHEINRFLWKLSHPPEHPDLV
ncbi:MAG: radical SAM protein [Magnetococcales bacterium]|nr:radical SAM protein [Magnetococcales bacterium]